MSEGYMNVPTSQEEIRIGVMKVLAPYIGNKNVTDHTDLKKEGCINKSSIETIRQGLQKEFNIKIEDYHLANARYIEHFITCVKNRFMDIEYEKSLKEELEQHNAKMTVLNEQLKPKTELYPNYNCNEPKCSICGSKSITAGNKGFGVGKAAAGAVLLGPVGLLGGFIGSKKTVVTCLNCGHKWDV